MNEEKKLLQNGRDASRNRQTFSSSLTEVLECTPDEALKRLACRNPVELLPADAADQAAVHPALRSMVIRTVMRVGDTWEPLGDRARRHIASAAIRLHLHAAMFSPDRIEPGFSIWPA